MNTSFISVKSSLILCDWGETTCILSFPMYKKGYYLPLVIFVPLVEVNVQFMHACTLSGVKRVSHSFLSLPKCLFGNRRLDMICILFVRRS